MKIIKTNKKESIQLSPEEDKIEYLIAMFGFNRPWKIKQPHNKIYSWKAKLSPKKHELNVCFKNIPEEAECIADLMFKSRGIEKFLPKMGVQLKAGILEIRIPVNQLKKIFNSVKSLMNDSQKSWMDTKMKIIKTQKETDIKNLIFSHDAYIMPFLVEIGNDLIENFTLETRGITPGHLTEKSEILILQQLKSGKVVYGSMSEFNKESSTVQENPKNDTLLESGIDKESNPLGHKRYIIKRISRLISEGFLMESVVVLNAFLEVLLKDIFLEKGIIKKKKKNDISYGRIIKNLKKLDDRKDLDSYFTEPKFKEILTCIKYIYDRRNDYAHDLKNPENEPYISIGKKREVLERINYFMLFGKSDTNSISHDLHYFIFRILDLDSVIEFLKNLEY